jgi:hypothetical protein
MQMRKFRPWGGNDQSGKGTTLRIFDPRVPNQGKNQG